MIGLFALVLLTIVTICIIKKCKKGGSCAKQEPERRGNDNKSKPSKIYEQFCIIFCSTIHVLLRLIVIILVCVHPTTEPDNRNYWPNYENLDEYGLPENDEYEGKQTGSAYGKPRMESPTYQNTIYENMNEDDTHKSASSSASPYGRNTFSYDLSNLA